MLRFRIPDEVWAFVFGVALTLYVGAIAFRYLPSPLEMFGDAGIECQQAAVHRQQESKGGQTAAESGAARLQNGEADKLKETAEYEKNVNECLIARYTGNLAQFTRWLVFATALLAAFGFWQVMISRDTARRQLRAYLVVEPAQLINFVEIVLTEAELDIRNVGQTPPHDVIMATIVDVNLYPPPEFICPSLQELKNESDPRSAYFHDAIGVTKSALEIFSNTKIAGVIAGKYRLYVGGRVYYKDIFGDQHHTDFLYMFYGPETRTMLAEQCRSGNKAT